MKNQRRYFTSYRCNWCSRVWTGGQWLPERRQAKGELYTHGLCDDCGVVRPVGGLASANRKAVPDLPSPVGRP